MTIQHQRFGRSAIFRKQQQCIWIAFLFAAMLLQQQQVASQFVQNIIYTDPSTAAPTQSPVPVFRCLGICGDEESNNSLKDPDLVVSYQWNLRVPVCSGLSCETETCSALEEELGLLKLTENECAKHREGLQSLCSCVRKPSSSSSENSSSTGPSSLFLGLVIGIPIAVFVLIVLLVECCRPRDNGTKEPNSSKKSKETKPENPETAEP